MERRNPAAMPHNRRVRFDLKTFQLFLAIVEEKSITKGAARVHIAPSAASRRVAELEEAFGAELLHRTPAGVTPSSAGLSVLHHAQAMFRSLDDMRSEVNVFTAGAKGIVRICANISAVVQYLPEDVASFRQQHPAIAIELREELSPDIVRSIMEGRGDIGILSPTPGTDHLHVEPYRTDRLAVVVPRDHPLAGRDAVAFADVLGHDFVGLQAGSSLDVQLRDAAARAGREIRIAVQVGSFDAACRMVHAGVGLGVVPMGIVALHAATLDVVPVMLRDPWSERAVSLCTRPGDVPPAARLFLDHLRARAAR